MVIGLDLFRKHFAGFEEQYVLIGGTACDVLFESNNGLTTEDVIPRLKEIYLTLAFIGEYY